MRRLLGVACVGVNTARTVCAGQQRRNCGTRDNTHRGDAGMSPRALRWAIGALLAYLAFLALVTAIGAGWHL